MRHKAWRSSAPVACKLDVRYCTTMRGATSLVTTTTVVMLLGTLLLSINDNHVTALRVTETTAAGAHTANAPSVTTPAITTISDSDNRIQSTQVSRTTSAHRHTELTSFRDMFAGESSDHIVGPNHRNTGVSSRDQNRRWRQVMSDVSMERRSMVKRDITATMPRRSKREARNVGNDDEYTLNLTCNQIHRFHNTYDTNITGVDLTCNGISDATLLSFDHLPTLRSLSLAGNNLTSFTDRNMFHSDSKSVRLLDLSANRLSALNATNFARLGNIEWLRLAHNDIGTIAPDTFGALQSLQLLDLSYNRIDVRAVPALQAIPALVALSVAFNRQLGAALQEFVATWSLKELDASGTGLCHVPAALAQSVHTLNVSHNHFEIIRRGDLDSYPLLKYLDMSNNNITDIEDDALGRLEILITLQLQHNLIASVPTNLPSSLVHLLMHDNRITDILPSTFAQLDNLETLDLSGNQLTYVPGLPLPRLFVLNLRKSGLRGLSQTVVQTSPNLKDLLLEGNPITCTALMSIAEWTTTCRTETTSTDEVDGTGITGATPQFATILSALPAVPSCCGRPMYRERLPPKPVLCKRQTNGKAVGNAAVGVPVKPTKISRRAKMEDIWRALSSESTTQSSVSFFKANEVAAVTVDYVTAKTMPSALPLVNTATNNNTIHHPSPAAAAPTADWIDTATTLAGIPNTVLARWRNGKSLTMDAAAVRRAEPKQIPSVAETKTPPTTATELIATTDTHSLVMSDNIRILAGGSVGTHLKSTPPTSLLPENEGQSKINPDASVTMSALLTLRNNSGAGTLNAPVRADESRPKWRKRANVGGGATAGPTPTSSPLTVPVSRQTEDDRRFAQRTPATSAPAVESLAGIIDDVTNRTHAQLASNGSTAFVGHQLSAYTLVEINRGRQTAAQSLHNEPNHSGEMLSDGDDNGSETTTMPTYNEHINTEKPLGANDSLASILIRRLRPALIDSGCHGRTCVDGNSHKNATNEGEASATTTTTSSPSNPLAAHAAHNGETNIYVAEQSLVAEIEPNDAVVAGGVMVVLGGDAPTPKRRRQQQQQQQQQASSDVIATHQKPFEAPPVPQAVFVHSSHLPVSNEANAAVFYSKSSSALPTNGLPEEWNELRSPAPHSRHPGMSAMLVITIGMFVMLLAVQLFRCTRSRRHRRHSGGVLACGTGAGGDITDYVDQEANQYAPSHRDMLPMELLDGAGSTIQYSEAPIEMW